ncbi:MAG: archaellin/type IV pilin N-terminal domain-containing protein [Chloroflexota bacterium]|nr:archaellin/type IV pilin N-terminal domain-containing protein [Chloroflexota bacterium]
MIRKLKSIHRSQEGITGLETAIILIAFVVVAAVFAYTVLSAGLFSTQKGQEAVYSGLEETSSTLELRGSVVAYTTEIQIDDCENAWDDTVAGVTTSADTDRKEGSYSSKLVIASGFAGGLVSYYDTSTLMMPTADKIRLWIKADSDVAASVFDLNLCSDNAGAVSVEDLAIPALSANEWTLVELSLADPSACTAIESVALYDDGDAAGVVNVWLDDIEIVPYVNKVECTVTNALDGDAIDVTPPYVIDSDGNGNLAPSNLDNVIQIAFSDDNTFIAECAWTLSWVGKHSDDYLLEIDENAVITVWLVDYPYSSTNSMLYYDHGSDDSDPFIDDEEKLIGTNHTFTLEVKPPKGAVLPIERTTPGYLDTVMDLH